MMGCKVLNGKVLDLRTNIDTFTFKINRKYDPKPVEILVIAIQLYDSTTERFNDLIRSFPNLKYLDLSWTHVNGAGADKVVPVLKEILDKGVIIDGRMIGYNVRRYLGDYTHKNLYLDGTNYKNAKFCDCGGERCEECSYLADIGGSIYDLIYGESEVDVEYIEYIRDKLEEVIKRLPDDAVDRVYNYLKGNTIHPSYPGSDKVTWDSTKVAIQRYMGQYRLEPTNNHRFQKYIYEGIIFNLFNLDPRGDVSWMFGWRSLFLYDAWSVQMSYVECKELYDLISS